MNLNKKELLELLRIFWKGISVADPRSKENGIWKKIEKELKKEVHNAR